MSPIKHERSTIRNDARSTASYIVGVVTRGGGGGGGRRCDVLSTSEDEDDGCTEPYCRMIFLSF
jgi:hypothetical protein